MSEYRVMRRESDPSTVYYKTYNKGLGWDEGWSKLATIDANGLRWEPFSPQGARATWLKFRQAGHSLNSFSGGGSASAGSVQGCQSKGSEVQWSWSRENLEKAFNGRITVGTHGQLIDTRMEATMINKNEYQNPEDMEKAALRLATLAQEIKAFDKREPEGDEPVISWKHTFEEGGREYVYVAVKLGGRWYVTGDRPSGRGYVWRDFLDLGFAEPLATGKFHLVTEWAYQGDE